MRYAIKRSVISLGMLVATSILIFAVLRALPGDPVLARLSGSQGVDQATIARLRAEAGLDRPLAAQYLSWVSGILHGDLGQSYFSHRPVSSLIAERFGPTLELTILAVALSILAVIPAAVVAAEKPGGWADRVVTAAAGTGMAFPPFVAGILLILVFSVGLHWLPARGYVPLTQISWGGLLQQGYAFLYNDPGYAVAPAVAILSTVLCLNLAADRLGIPGRPERGGDR